MTEDKKSLTKIAAYLCELPGQNKELFIVLDSSNNIVYAHDKAGAFLKKEISEGANILEASLDEGMIKLVSLSNENPGKEENAAVAGRVLSALSFGEKGHVYGTVISSL